MKHNMQKQWSFISPKNIYICMACFTFALWDIVLRFTCILLVHTHLNSLLTHMLILTHVHADAKGWVFSKKTWLMHGWDHFPVKGRRCLRPVWDLLRAAAAAEMAHGGSSESGFSSQQDRKSQFKSILKTILYSGELLHASFAVSF